MIDHINLMEICLIRVAVIGLGKIAQQEHLPAIASDSRFELVATVSRSKSVPGILHYPSIDALIGGETQVDAVSLCMPPQARAYFALSAIAAGYDVMLEKPPAGTVSGLRQITAAAASGKRVLMATWHSRYAPMVEKAREWLSGRTVICGRITWREDVHHWHPGQTWLWEPGGLGVFDPGINAISILTALTDLPVCIDQAEFEIPDNCHTPIGARLALSMGHAKVDVDFDFRQTGEQTWDIELETSDGANLALRMGGAVLEVSGKPREARPSAEYPAMYDHFAKLIAARRSDADSRPLELVADAFLIARVRHVAPFFP